MTSDVWQNVWTYAARTDFAVAMPTGTVRVNCSVDAARARAIALFQLRQSFFGIFQLFYCKKLNFGFQAKLKGEENLPCL